MRKAFGRRAWATLAVLALVACGNVYADPVERGFSSPTSLIDSGVSAPRVVQPACPNFVSPTAAGQLENSPCLSTGQVCEYGVSPDPQCNTTYRCVQDDTSFGLYFTESASPSCAFTCPDPGAIVDGAPCDLTSYGDGGANDELQCATPLGTCACTTGPDGAHAHPRRWVCVKPADGCPPDRPRFGQLCVGEHSCDYGACAFERGARMQCQDETWQIEAAPCP